MIMLSYEKDNRKFHKIKIRTNDNRTAFNYNVNALQECGTIKSFVRGKERFYGTDCI